MSGVSAATVSSPSHEREPQRGVALGELADPARDLQELLARQPDLVLERLRHELAPARKLPLDQARGDQDARGPEDDLVARQGDLDFLRPSAATIRASSRSARAGTLASSACATAASSFVCLTLSRYESVATIVSVSPSA